MSDKLTLTNLSTFDNSIIDAVNTNNAAIVTALDKSLSRDGTTPNQMQNALDMNSYPIINLPAPGSPSSPARLQDVTGEIADLSLTVSLTGDVNAAASSGVLTTTVDKINGSTLGTTTPTSGNILIGNGTQWNTEPVSGAITMNSSGVTTLGSNTVSSSNIASGAVGLSQLSNITAHSVLGNNTGSAAAPTALNQTQLTAMVNPFTTSLSGATPASGGGTSNFLRADGAWTVPHSAQSVALLNTLTASGSANLQDTTSLTNLFTIYEVYFQLVQSTSSEIRLQLHSSGAFKTTGYSGSVYKVDGSGASITGTPLTSYLSLTGTVTASGNNIGKLTFFNPSASQITYVKMEAVNPSNGLFTYGVGFWNTTSVIDGFQIFPSTGTFTSGFVKVYGYV